MFITNAWYVAAWPEEITSEPLARRICNEPLVLFRDSITGNAVALADFCCHRGAPLSAGRCVPAGIECGYHGIVYSADGACVLIPGQVHVPAKVRIRSYPVVEKDGCVWIWMGDPAFADASTIIDYPYHTDTEHWPNKHTMYPIAANSMLMVDNLMDLTHLPFTHRSTIGGNASSDHVSAKMDITPSESGLHYIRWLLNHEPPPTYRKACPTLADRVDRWQQFDFVAPSIVFQYSGATTAGAGAYEHGKRDGGVQLRVFHALTPETETSCMYFWAGAHGHSPDNREITETLFGELGIAFREDQHIVELQQRRLVEFGEAGLINIVADGARVHMRRVVERLADKERHDRALARS